MAAEMQTLGLGFTWEQLSVGQKFRTLKIALITVGVLRGSTLRASLPLSRKVGSVSSSHDSRPLRPMNSPKVPPKVPCEEETSLVVNSMVELRSSESETTWKGKSDCLSW